MKNGKEMKYKHQTRYRDREKVEKKYIKRFKEILTSPWQGELELKTRLTRIIKEIQEKAPDLLNSEYFLNRMISAELSTRRTQQLFEAAINKGAFALVNFLLKDKELYNKIEPNFISIYHAASSSKCKLKTLKMILANDADYLTIEGDINPLRKLNARFEKESYGLKDLIEELEKSYESNKLYANKHYRKFLKVLIAYRIAHLRYAIDLDESSIFTDAKGNERFLGCGDATQGDRIVSEYLPDYISTLKKSGTDITLDPSLVSLLSGEMEHNFKNFKKFFESGKPYSFNIRLQRHGVQMAVMGNYVIKYNRDSFAKIPGIETFKIEDKNKFIEYIKNNSDNFFKEKSINGNYYRTRIDDEMGLKSFYSHELPWQEGKNCW